MSLRGADGTEKRAELKLAKADEENADASEDRAVFSDLDAGTYVLRVSAPGYVTYEQSMEVKNLGYRIQLYAGRLPLLEKEGKAQPGLLLYGDVNGDGAVDERDAYAVIDAAEAGQVSGLCDLNETERLTFSTWTTLLLLWRKVADRRRVRRLTYLLMRQEHRWRRSLWNLRPKVKMPSQKER